MNVREEIQTKLTAYRSRLNPTDQFELYVLTGHFAEISKRSQLTYLFHKGRPTIAIREMEEGLHPLCALCLHPMGYYGKLGRASCVRLTKSLRTFS